MTWLVFVGLGRRSAGAAVVAMERSYYSGRAQSNGRASKLYADKHKQVNRCLFVGCKSTVWPHMPAELTIKHDVQVLVRSYEVRVQERVYRVNCKRTDCKFQVKELDSAAICTRYRDLCGRRTAFHDLHHRLD